MLALVTGTSCLSNIDHTMESYQDYHMHTCTNILRFATHTTRLYDGYLERNRLKKAEEE